MSYILKILLVVCMVNVVTCVFFHEPSAIPLKAENGIDFGFSMGFQKRNNMLVVSAPIENNTMHSSHHTIGKVFTCPVDMSRLNDIKCDRANIDVEALAKYEINGISPNQNFLLGASIATTQDYFLTCAPLWTQQLTDSKSNRFSFSFGTCFVYYGNGKAHQYLGYPEQCVKKNKCKSSISVQSLEGGIGWNTLVDEANELILITKPFSSVNERHITYYLNTKKPLDPISHVPFRQHNIQNIGFGLAAGNFFSDETSYAVSYQEFDMKGVIIFLEKDKKTKNRLKIKCFVNNGKCIEVKISIADDVGSMYGYSMAAVDINGDGFTELIVGAPAQRDETREYGAIHIYAGGRVESIKESLNIVKKTIFGDAAVEGRFGMTIATSDIDGDNIPEIIVSAPYEDSGKGAVYIISGHKVKTLFASPTKQIQVSKLEPQRIQKTDFALFGYSLQVIEDLDGNGCNELAIGSPGSSTVHLFRSLQAVKVNVNLKTDRQKISDKDSKFDVQVCVSMEFNKKATHIEGKILVNNFALGNGVKIDNPTFDVDLSEVFKNKKSLFCKNVTAHLKNSDVGIYTFSTEIEMFGLQKSLEERDFSKTVAVFSSHSNTKQSIEIERRCDGDDCKPKLSMEVVWSAGSEYLLGTSENETLTVTVRNDGFNANGGCVHVSVNGAQVRRIKADCRKIDNDYRCYLRNPLRRNTTEVIALVLDMVTNITNLNKSLEMRVALYDDCYNTTYSNDLQLRLVDYKINTSVISLTNEIYNLDITEKSLSEEAVEILNVNQVYLIQNTGKFKWQDLDAVITFNTTDFEFSVKEIHNCSKSKEIGHKLKCKLDLEPNSVTKIILGIEIKKESIGQYIKKVKETKIESFISLTLTETTIRLTSRSESVLTYNKDTSVGNNKTLLVVIGVLVALLLFGGLCFILYKYGFFQGQNKKKLDRARATVRQKSIKRSTTSQDTQKLHEDGGSPCDMEIVDDNAFDEPPTAASNKDSHKLIEEKAQVHNEDKH